MIKQDHLMKPAVSKLTEYMRTYDSQHGYKSFDTTTYMNDVLYGLGISLSDEYKFAGGYAQFKKDLLEFLNE